MRKRDKERQTIYRVHKTPGQFALIHKGFLLDPMLDFAAKGMLAYLLSRPDDWTPMMGNLMTVSGQGRGAIKKIERTLRAAGYQRKSSVRCRKSGRIVRYVTVTFETPEAAANAVGQIQGTLFEVFEPLKNLRFSTNSPQRENRSPVNGDGETRSPVNDPLLRMSEPKIETTNGCEKVGGGANTSRPMSAAERFLLARKEARRERGSV